VLSTRKPTIVLRSVSIVCLCNSLGRSRQKNASVSEDCPGRLAHHRCNHSTGLLGLMDVNSVYVSWGNPRQDSCLAYDLIG
jgi:hypothetical protein